MSREAWRSRDYIAKRSYCPPQAVAQELQALADKVNAEGLILSFHRLTFLRSLSFFALSDGDQKHKLADALNESHTPPKNRLVLREVSRASGTRSILQALSRDQYLARLLEPVRAQWSATRIGAPALRSEAIWGYLFLSSPISPDVAEDMSERLFEMLNATPNASIQRDAAVVQLVERHASQPTSGVEEAISGLLQLAIDVTNSDAAALLSTTATRGALTGNPQRTIARGAEQLVGAFGLGSRRTDRTIAHASLARRRTMVLELASGPRLPGSSTPSWSTRRRPIPAQSFEVSIPVPGMVFETGAPLVGVLSVLHVGAREGRFFGSYDFALLRNVALRLSNLLLNERHASITSELRRMASRRQPLQARAAVHDDIVVADDEESTQAAIPFDYRAPLEEIRPTLEVIARATNANAVTLRLLVIEPSTKARPTRSLLRVAAFPEGRISSARESVPLDTDWSRSAWAARHGETCDLHNVRSAKSYHKYEGLARSKAGGTAAAEISIPLKVDNGLIGTLTLESEHVGAFIGFEEELRLVADHIGLLFGATRQGLTERTLTIASSLQRRGHEILQRVDLFKMDADAVRSDAALADVVERAAEDLYALVRARRSPQTVDDQPSNTAVADIVGAVEDKAKTKGIVKRDVHPSVATARPRSSFVAQALQEALLDIMQNLAFRSSREVSMQMRFVTVGGIPLLEITFTHSTTNVRSVALTSYLYRVPVLLSANDRLHLGGFSAGALMRAVEGDVFFRLLSLERESGEMRVQTVLTVPIATQSDDAMRTQLAAGAEPR